MTKKYSSKKGKLVLRKTFSELIYIIIGLSLGYCGFINAQQEPSEFVEGVDYFRVEHKVTDQAIELEALHQVADIEVFYWYGCAVCQQVETALAEYHRQHAELSYTRTPLIAYLSWRPQAYLQPLMELLSKHMEVPDKDILYTTCLSDCSVFNSYEAIKAWLINRQQLSELPFFDEREIWLAEKNYQKRADSFSIRQVPTIIIRETFKVDANSAKSNERLLQIVDYLLHLNP